MPKASEFGVVLLALAIPFQYVEAWTRWESDLESGVVLSGYNDVRIPGDSGTLISLSEELTTDPNVFVRARISYLVGDKHTLSLLAAPLRLVATGSVARPVLFEGEEFPEDAPLRATYRFDSYRLTYRYNIYRTDGLDAGVGLTAKIRDASISLESGETKREKKNTGFVPLINLRVAWMPAKRLGILMESDALAAPQGRAEDILAAIRYLPTENVGLRLGYRVLEGGADIDEVYNFALIHYVIVGATLSF